MKRVGLIASLTCTITLIVSLTTLLILALIHDNKYDIKDSMVFIESISNNSTKEGMGFVYKIDNDSNYIITNYHVIADSNYLYVYNLDNEKEKASIVDYDSYTDIAILQIDDELDLSVVQIGTTNIKVDDKIYYFNINKNIIESGLVLSLDNEINLNTSYGNSFYRAVSIKGNIDNGNSGGPLLDSENNVIGLISLKEDNTDIGFYIPIEETINIVTKLENHSLSRPNLGGIFATSTNHDALNQYGLAITDVIGVVIIETTENYPLNVSGLIKGDIITKVNDIAINDVSSLQQQIYSYNIGETITLEYYRNGICNKVDVTLNK